MTPVPPSSSDGQQLPPRHRPALGDLSKDTTETDLWDLDDDLVMPDDPAPTRPDVIRGSRELPAPREKRKTGDGETEEGGGRLPAPGKDRIRLNVGKVRQSERDQGEGSRGAPDGDFDELDDWEDVPSAPEIGDLPEVSPVGEAPVTVPEPESAPAVEDPEETAEPSAGETAESAPAPVEDDEFSPVAAPGAQPVSLRPRLGLSSLERAGLIALVVLLLVVAVTAYVFSVSRLPRETVRASETDFPIKGAMVSVKSATSYWRAPITDGANPDTFRRGTRLLPVLDIDIESGSGAIRVLFRNADRLVVGDAVTRSVRPGARLSVPATAGFDDAGMYAAYRTGDSKPWTIEVYEAAAEDAAGRDFKKVFEMNVSTDQR